MLTIKAVCKTPTTLGNSYRVVRLVVARKKGTTRLISIWRIPEDNHDWSFIWVSDFIPIITSIWEGVLALRLSEIKQETKKRAGFCQPLKVKTSADPSFTPLWFVGVVIGAVVRAWAWEPWRRFSALWLTWEPVLSGWIFQWSLTASFGLWFNTDLQCLGDSTICIDLPSPIPENMPD